MIQSNVVIVAQLISRTNARLIDSPALNATELVIMPLNAELTAVQILPKIQGNLPGFVVEADHPGVEDFLQEDKLTKQLRSLKPSLMRNLT